MLAYFEWLIVIFPLIGALVNGLLGRRLSHRAQGWIACAAVSGSLLVDLPLLASQLLSPGLVGLSEPLPWFAVWTGRWFVSGPLALRIDALSVFAVSTALAVGMFVHVHTARHTDAGASRHLVLSLMNGVMAATLLLILADNLLCLLLGWSLSGLGMHQLAQGCGHGFAPSSRRSGRRREDADEGRGTGLQGMRSYPFLFSLFSDLCILVTIGLLSETRESLSISAIVTGESPGTQLLSTPGTLNAVAVLLVLAAVLRGAQFPFHVWLPGRGSSGANAFVYALVSVLSATYLVARARPAIELAPLASSLLSWWGVCSAVLMALVVLAQEDVKRLSRSAAVGGAGLLMVALGQGTYSLALSFLPAWVLSQTLVSLAIGDDADTRMVDPRARAGRLPAKRWIIAFGLAASAGVPLLPGFAFASGLLGATARGSAGLWILTALALFLLSAAAVRAAREGATGPSPAAGELSGGLLVLVLAAVLLGWLNLASLSPIGWFLAPVLGQVGDRPAWWWYAIEAGIVGMGAGAGYWASSWLQKIPTGVRKWIAQGYLVHGLYGVAITDPLLSAGRFVARGLEARAVRWTMGEAALRLDRAELPDEKPDPSMYLPVLLLLIGTALVVGYLVTQ